MYNVFENRSFMSRPTSIIYHHQNATGMTSENKYIERETLDTEIHFERLAVTTYFLIGNLAETYFLIGNFGETKQWLYDVYM